MGVWGVIGLKRKLPLAFFNRTIWYLGFFSGLNSRALLHGKTNYDLVTLSAINCVPRVFIRAEMSPLQPMSLFAFIGVGVLMWYLCYGLGLFTPLTPGPYQM